MHDGAVSAGPLGTDGEHGDVTSEGVCGEAALILMSDGRMNNSEEVTQGEEFTQKKPVFNAKFRHKQTNTQTQRDPQTNQQNNAGIL